MLDENTERRLGEEEVGWLTTVRSDGQPQPVPVWFLWDGQTFLVYSEPSRQKLKNLRRNPRVSINLNSDATGGGIVRADGEAEVLRDFPPASEVRDYVEKYREGIARIGMDVERFSRAYSVAVRITPLRWQVW